MADIFLSYRPSARPLWYGEAALAGLRRLGTVRLNEREEPLTVEQVLDAASGCPIIVSERMTEAPAALFQRAADLVAFVRCAVDIRNIDVAAASRAGILVTRASPGFVPAIAELVVGMLVDLARGVSAATAAYQQGEVPRPSMGRQLAGSTLGIIGYGAIGRYLAPLGLALRMEVLIADPHVTVLDPALEQVALPDLLARSDFVVCLAVATEETEALMDADAFARMKRGACFVNVSRGNLVDEAALAAALESGHLAGAAMDVGRAGDQMPSPNLARAPNVISTPHIGGLTPQAIAHQALETVGQVASILQGKPPLGAVNADRARRLRALA